MSRFQKLAVATAASTVVLFAIGGLVRGTGSGLGCSGWPKCGPGRWLPYPNAHSLIEYSHRTMVVVTSVLIGLLAVAAWRGYRSVAPIFRPAIAAVPLVLAQAVLGGIVVRTDLNPWWVTVHFAVALALVADVVYLATCTFLDRGSRVESPPASGFARRHQRLTWAATAALLLVGTYVRARSAGLVFSDWPLMDGRLVPALGGAATAMFLHRVLAALVFVLVLYVVVRARTMAERSRDLVVVSTLAAGLFLVQILVGAAQVWTGLKAWAVVMHVALSVLIWATLVALATVARRTTALSPRRRRRTRPRTGSASGAPRHDHGLRDAHEAADHRAAADHDRAGDGAGAAGAHRR